MQPNKTFVFEHESKHEMQVVSENYIYLDNYCSSTIFLKGFKSPVKAEDVFENAGRPIKEELAGAQRERVAKCEDLS